MTAEQLLAWVKQLEQSYPHGHLSLTGGEPLLHQYFLEEFLPLSPLPVYLETGGHRPTELAALLPHLAWVSMDLKLPSSCGERPLWAEHLACLQHTHRAQVPTYTKWVVTANTTTADLLQARDLVAQVNSQLLTVLQPVTPFAGILAPSVEQVLEWQRLLRETLQDVRVIPQTHKFLGQL